MENQILSKIKEYNTIIIHRHVNPDPDAIGSQSALQEIIQTSFPNKKVFVVGEEVEGLTFLNRMEAITPSTYKGALVIVCDTANTKRISCEKEALNGDFLIKIDHHPDFEPFGDLSWVDTSYSSTCEMLVSFVLQNDLTLTDKAARLLFAGMVGDTGRFLYNNTTSKTLLYASRLLNYNFDPQEIYSRLNEMSKNTAQLNGKILQDFIVTDNGVAYFHITNELLETFQVDKTEAANLVNTLKDIEGNKVWVFFTDYPDEIRVRIRSSKTDISSVARNYNGGGHPLASGATVHSLEEAQNLIDDLDKLLK